MASIEGGNKGVAHPTGAVGHRQTGAVRHQGRGFITLASANRYRAPGRGHLQGGDCGVCHCQLRAAAEDLAVDAGAGVEGGGAGVGPRGQAGDTDGSHAGIAAAPAGIQHRLAAAIGQHGGRAVLLGQTYRRPQAGGGQLQCCHCGVAHLQLRRSSDGLTIEGASGRDGRGAGTHPLRLPPEILLIADGGDGAVTTAPAHYVRHHLTGAIREHSGGNQGQCQADRRRARCRGHLQGGDCGVAHRELRRATDALALEEAARTQAGHARPYPGRQPLRDCGGARIIAGPAHLRGHIQGGTVGELQGGGKALAQARRHQGGRGRHLQPYGLGIADLQLRPRLDRGAIGPHS